MLILGFSIIRNATAKPLASPTRDKQAWTDAPKLTQASPYKQVLIGMKIISFKLRDTIVVELIFWKMKLAAFIIGSLYAQEAYDYSNDGKRSPCQPELLTRV